MSENGTVRCWDHEDCPRDDCDGELQQQDRFNVMCLNCETVFTHQKDDDEHRLIHDCEFVARKPRAMSDGGSAEDDTYHTQFHYCGIDGPTEVPEGSSCPSCGWYADPGGERDV